MSVAEMAGRGTNYTLSLPPASHIPPLLRPPARAAVNLEATAF